MEKSHHNNHVQCAMLNNIQCKTKISLKKCSKASVGISTHKQQLICVNFQLFSLYEPVSVSMHLSLKRNAYENLPHSYLIICSKPRGDIFISLVPQINRLIICNLQIAHLMRFAIVRKCKYRITSYRCF